MVLIHIQYATLLFINMDQRATEAQTQLLEPGHIIFDSLCMNYSMSFVEYP